MLRCDTAYAKEVLEQLNAAEAAAAAAGGGSGGGGITDAEVEADEDEPLLGKHASAGATALEPGLGKDAAEGVDDFGGAEVLPWWLPPERIPPEHSGERQAGRRHDQAKGAGMACARPLALLSRLLTSPSQKPCPETLCSPPTLRSARRACCS